MEMWEGFPLLYGFGTVVAESLVSALRSPLGAISVILAVALLSSLAAGVLGLRLLIGVLSTALRRNK